MIKQTDIAMIILITAVSLVAAYLIGGAIINTPESRSTEVEIAVPISSEFPEPDSRIFNENSINPTEKIEIGDSNSDKPFQN
jgi:hypothetical protein